GRYVGLRESFSPPPSTQIGRTDSGGARAGGRLDQAHLPNFADLLRDITIFSPVPRQSVVTSSPCRGEQPKKSFPVIPATGSPDPRLMACREGTGKDWLWERGQRYPPEKP